MAENETTEGQEQTPPDTTGQATEAVFDVDGQNIPASELVNRYKDSVRGMNEAQQRAADHERSLQDYKSWADPIRDRYNQDPAFAQDYQGLWNGQALDQQTQQNVAPNPLDHNVQELQRNRVEIEAIKNDREFDKLRGEGNELTKEMESEILRVKATNPTIPVRAVYRDLYWDSALQRQREHAVSETADKIASNKGTYPKTPKGTHKESPKSSQRGKSTGDKFRHFMDNVAGSLDFE